MHIDKKLMHRLFGLIAGAIVFAWLVLDTARANPGRIIAPVRSDGRGGNPCFFPARFFPELSALTGDTGGRRVIAAHPEAVIHVPVSDWELFDTDSPAALEELKKEMDFELWWDGACSKERVIENAPKGMDGFVLGTTLLFGQETSYAETLKNIRELKFK